MIPPKKVREILDVLMKCQDHGMPVPHDPLMAQLFIETLTRMSEKVGEKLHVPDDFIGDLR